LTVAVALRLIAATLFRIGPLHGEANVAAVLLMFAFWIILNGWGLRADATPALNQQTPARGNF
jgi:hypothetical protein